MRRIYMDANATTPLLPEVFEAMRPFFLEHYGNASSIHQQGQFARAAILRAAESLQKKNVGALSPDIQVTFLPSTPQGLIEPAALQAAIRPNTKLVSIMFANNETGVIQPIAELAAIAHAAGALFHTDAVQASGKLPLDLSADGPLKHVDLLTLSGHKIYGPKGIGVLFARRNVRLTPMLHGGTHERQRRAGTENVAGIVGLGKALELAQAWLASDKPA